MMQTLALVLPLLMADPTTPPEALRPPTPKLQPTPELPRQAGLGTEVGTGISLSSLPTETAPASLTGATVRMWSSYRFLLGPRFRLGPTLTMGASLGEASLDDGTKVSGSLGQITLAPELELEITRATSLLASVGPSLVASREIYLGPEISFGLAQHLMSVENKRRLGIAFRGTFAPMFPLTIAGTEPGYVALFTLAFTGGMP